jgi:D-inositol-3-phosphate glycosyltransferase
VIWRDRRLSLACVLPSCDLRDGSSRARQARTLARALAREASVTLVFRRVLADTAGEPFAVAQLEPGRGEPGRVERGRPASGRALSRFVEQKAGAFDLVLEGSWPMSGKLSAWCARRGIPAIPVVDLLPAARWLPLRTDGPWLALASSGRHLRHAPVVITPTDELKRQVASRWRVEADRIVVGGRALDQTLFTPGDQAEARRRLGWSPEHRILLAADGTDRAAADLGPLIEAVQRAGDPGLRLYVLGDGPRTPALRRLAGPAGPVVFHGPMTDPELATCLAAADLAISVDDRTDPVFTAMESLSAGLPMAVTADGRSAPTAGGRTGGFVVSPDLLGWIRFLQRDCPSRKALRAMGMAVAAGSRAQAGRTPGAYLEAIERARPQAPHPAAFA